MMRKVLFLIAAAGAAALLIGCGHNSFQYGDGVGFDFGVNPENWTASMNLRYGKILTAVTRDNVEIELSGNANGTLDCDEHPLDYLALVFLYENCVAALDSENWKEKMEEQLFPVKPDFEWTGRRELAYLKMMESIAEDIEDVAEPGPGEKLLIQITY